MQKNIQADLEEWTVSYQHLIALDIHKPCQQRLITELRRFKPQSRSQKLLAKTSNFLILQESLQPLRIIIFSEDRVKQEKEISNLRPLGERLWKAMFVRSKAQHAHHLLPVVGGVHNSLIMGESPTAGMLHVSVGIATCLSGHLLSLS